MMPFPKIPLESLLRRSGPPGAGGSCSDIRSQRQYMADVFDEAFTTLEPEPADRDAWYGETLRR